MLLNTAELEHYKAFKHTPVIFSRQLLQMAFPRQVLATCSLFGRQSNANKDKEVLPALDNKILSDVIGN